MLPLTFLSSKGGRVESVIGDHERQVVGKEGGKGERERGGKGDESRGESEPSVFYNMTAA